MTIFSKYNLLAAAKKSTHLALKEHVQIPFMIDVLCRQRLHHIALAKYTSEKIPFALMQSLAARLSLQTSPKIFRDIHFIYFDAKSFILGDEKLTTIEDDFHATCEDLRLTSKKMIFVLNKAALLFNAKPQTPAGLLGKLLKSVLLNEQWRLIVLCEKLPHKTADFFTTIELLEPSDADLLAILKSYQTELEHFHQVIITDEIFSSAISMTHHYLSGTPSLDKALELLDSASARAAAMTHNDSGGQHSIVTNMHLAQVISSWTHIPLTHLQHNKFQANKFIEAARHVIFGHDNATQTIGSLLQNACIKLHKKPGPLCSFLLAGPPGVGKATLVQAMAEHLFGHHQALLRIYANGSDPENIKVLVGGQKEYSMNLLTAVQKTPYAMLFLENIEQQPPHLLHLLKNILVNGCVFDAQGKKYDFSNTIIIASTTLVSDYLHGLIQQNTQQKPKSIDLMQLVMNDTLHPGSHPPASSQEIREEMVAILTKHVTGELLHYFNVIPFMPLDYSALEKIMRLKLKALAKRLEVSFGIELNYAPEVMQFLAYQAALPGSKNIDRLLEQYLYTGVSQELVACIDDKHKPKVLSLRLNESGQLLRCETMTANEAALYQL